MADDTWVEKNITHQSKHVQWGGATGLADFIEEGVDWSGAAFVMTFAPAIGGAAIGALTLTNVAAGSQGISATYDATYVNDAGARVGATTVRPQINEATFEALTFPAAPAPYELVYDLIVTPVTPAIQRGLYFGSYTIGHGVGD